MIKSLFGALLAGETRQLAARARLAAICYGLAGLCFLIAAGFVIAAGFIALAEQVGSLEAALWFAGGFLLLSLVIFTIQAVMRRAAERRRRAERASEWQALAIASALTLLPGLARSKLGLAALLTPLVGLVAWRVIEENRTPRTPDSEE